MSHEEKKRFWVQKVSFVAVRGCRTQVMLEASGLRTCFDLCTAALTYLRASNLSEDVPNRGLANLLLVP